MRHLGFVAVSLFVVSTAGGLELPALKVAKLGDLALEGGGTLSETRLAYRLAGKLNAERSNAILFPTWFTGTSEDLFTSGALNAIDTDRFFLITVDAFGNGVSSSPSNHPDFPAVTIGDMVRAQYRLVTEVLGLERLHAVIGISMGGMQTFEWITAYPGFMDRAMPIAGSPRLASYDILLWETQLEAIELARQSGDIERAAPLTSMISTLALQTPQYHARRTPRSKSSEFLQTARQTGTQAMADREAQLRAMLRHDVSRRFDGSMEKAASAVGTRLVNVVGLTDQMVTPQPAIRFAALVGAQSLELTNDCGHLASDCEPARFEKAIQALLE